MPAEIIDFAAFRAAVASTGSDAHAKTKALGAYLGALAINEAYDDGPAFSGVIAALDEARRYVGQVKLRDMASRLLDKFPLDGPGAA
ncbi:hypothetical protein U1839_06195 [Sphingomonas sp. RT2P30]|uniref:hypothetical protein n=1 Tax=Parasphingomonas halimpatiens TaxID=3096162 RepID=UPI002FCC9D4C